MHDSPDLIAPEKSVTKPGSTLSFLFYFLFFFCHHIYFQSSMGALPHRVSCLNVSIGPCISPCSLLGTLRYMLVLPYFCLVSPSPSPSPFLLLLLCTYSDQFLYNTHHGRHRHHHVGHRPHHGGHLLSQVHRRLSQARGAGSFASWAGDGGSLQGLGMHCMLEPRSERVRSARCLHQCGSYHSCCVHVHTYVFFVWVRHDEVSGYDIKQLV